MTGAILLARLALATVLLIAGTAKLADQRGSRTALTALGLPGFVATSLALALPALEIIVSMALLPAALAPWGAWGALVLLIGFTVAVAAILIRGVEADCRCFGQIHPARVGWSTLGRNVALTGLAAFVVIGQRWGEPPGFAAWLGGFSRIEWIAAAALAMALVLAAAAGWFGMHLMRQQGRILLRLDALERALRERGAAAAEGAAAANDPAAIGPESLPVGTPAPAFEAPGFAGGSTSLRELLGAGLPVALLFTQPRCAPCTALLPEMAAWQRASDGRFTLAVITQAPVGEHHRLLTDAGIRHVLVPRDAEINDAFGIRLNPSAVLIAPDGTIAGGVAEGAVAIRALVASHSSVPMPVDRRPAPPAADRRSPLDGPVAADGTPAGILSTAMVSPPRW